jgi:hypothetical protein
MGCSSDTKVDDTSTSGTVVLNCAVVKAKYFNSAVVSTNGWEHYYHQQWLAQHKTPIG